jgi:hypothetical protein
MWTLDGQPGRGETCMKCRSDLRVCLNCAHYDPSVAQQCRERRAEPLLEKAAGNFCEYFEFVRRAWTPKGKINKHEASAREQLKKLSAIKARSITVQIGDAELFRLRSRHWYWKDAVAAFHRKSKPIARKC